MIAERHSLYGGSVATLDVTRVNYRESVTAPYQTITLTAKSPPTLRPATFGDWIVLRLESSGPALTFGIVVNVQNAQSVSQTGVPDFQTWTVTCVGWFDLLGRTDFQVAYNLTVQSNETRSGAGTGTLFDYAELEAIAAVVAAPKLAQTDLSTQIRAAFGERTTASQTLLQALGGFQGVGSGLAWFMALAPRLFLPGSLGGQAISQAVAVAHNDDTLSALAGPGVSERKGAPAYVMDPVPGRYLPNLSPTMAASKMLATIKGTWGGDENLVEMFPALEDPAAPSAPVAPAETPTDNWQPGSTPTGFRANRAADAVVRPEEDAALSRERRSPDGLTGGSSLLPGLAKTLGRNPVLMYRMRPWRTQPLPDWTAAVADLDPRFARLRRRVTDYVSTTPGTWSRVTWSVSKAQTLDAREDVVRLNQTATDDDMPTVFTTEWPGTGSTAGFMARSGLPIVFTDASYTGSRIYTASWPFIRDEGKRAQDTKSTPASEGDKKDSIVNEAVTVAAQAAQFLGMRGLAMMRGSFTSRFRPDIRPGFTTAVTWPGGEPRLTCYAETVEHDLMVSGGRVTSRTTVQFSRGLWDESLRYLTVPARARPEAGADASGRRGLASGTAPTDYVPRVDDGVTPLREMMPPTGLE